MKLRPVLLLTGSIGPVPEVVVAYISSVVPAQLLPTDLVIDPAAQNFRSSGLKVFSVLRLHKVATIHVSSLARRLGQIAPADNVPIANKLRTLLALD